MSCDLNLARPGYQFEAQDGSIWEYVGRWGGDEEMAFPHRLRCIDTDRQDSFTPEGWDAVTTEYRRHALVWQVPRRSKTSGHAA